MFWGLNVDQWQKVAAQDVAFCMLLLKTIMIPLMIYGLVMSWAIHQKMKRRTHDLLHLLSALMMTLVAGLVIYCWFVISYGNTAMVFGVPALALMKIETGFWAKKSFADEYTFA